MIIPERFIPLLNRVTEFLYSPIGSTALTTTFVTLGTAALTNYFQQRKARIFPVVFSESQNLAFHNEAIDFYSALNDMIMNVTDAWNKSKKSRRQKTFLKEIDRFHLNDNTQKVERSGETLLSKLQNHIALRNAAVETAEAFDSSWDYTSDDNYTTIMVPYTTTDSKGNVSTHFRTEQRYSDTDHYFTFYPEKAQEAQKKLENIISEFKTKELYNPKLSVEMSEIKMKVNFGSEEAIKKTVFENENCKVTGEEILKFMNQWIIHANINSELENVNKNLTYLNEVSPEALPVIAQSKSKYHFNTTSTSHSGPEGYRFSRSFADSCRGIANPIDNLDSSIKYCIENAKKLRALVDDNSLQENKKPKHIAHEALGLAVESYLEAFSNSEINMDQRVKHGKTALVALGAGVLAGLTTLLLHPKKGIFY